MAVVLLKRYLPVSLALLIYYGSASRFSGGATSTAAFYNYQVERSPDDGSVTARIIPVVDLLVATAILRPGLSRKIATCFVALTIGGLAVQRAAGGLPCRADVVQAVWAAATAVVGFI